MTKDDALVVQETREILEVLPAESRSDVELVRAIAGSLREGQDRHDVEIKAIRLAHQRLESRVDKGFELIAKDLTQIKHAAEKDRIHASYAQKAAEQAKAEVSQTKAEVATLWRSLYEVQTVAKVAESKADGAKDIAKESRKGFGIDPTWVMVFTAALIFIVLSLFTRVEKVPQTAPAKESQGSVIRCGVDVSCSYTGTPRPVKNGV